MGLGIDAGDVYPGDGGASRFANKHSSDGRFRAPCYFFIDDQLLNPKELKAGISGRGGVLRLLPAEDIEAAPGEGIGMIGQKAAIDLLETACGS